MNKGITGLHHVTAMTSDAQENIDFYAGILGLRLVKKTINFDSPDIWHFYYGDRIGNPGTLLTFFPFTGMPRGRKGNGQVTTTSFSVSEKSFDYWLKRFSSFGVIHLKPKDRFNESYIYFEDPDGLGLELVAAADDSREGFTYGNIPPEYSIKGFYGVTLNEENHERTAGLLMGQMDHDLIAEKDDRFRFSAGDNSFGFVDIVHTPWEFRSRGGSGTIHHVAFATANDVSQNEFRERLLDGGIVSPTPVIDRQYFHSVYFREPGGVLFEAATSDIGFTIDESEDQLGSALKLPQWEEKNRHEIESALPHVELEIDKFSDAQVQHN
ncbi:MAG TPA: VOC family protein [Bacteroidales bacterium]|nr:VOC family protein [Bacteroidales bacterium]